MTNLNTICILQHIHNVILEGLASIIMEHLLKVKRDAITEQVPSLGGSFSMTDSVHIFPMSARHLGLDDFLP